MVITPKDSFDRPTILGNYNGSAVPVKAEEDGSICVTSKSSVKLELVQSVTLDLSIARTGQWHDISFDGFAVGRNEGIFSISIGDKSEGKMCTIDKCLWMGVVGEGVTFSNTAQPGKQAEVWFFKEKGVK